MRVGLIVPPGFVVMSRAPLSVFEIANERARKPLYEIHLLSEEGGRIPNAFGMDIWTRKLEAERFDTVLLGSGSSASPARPHLVRFLRDAAEHPRRIASISVAAFALAEAGILDGRRATTHWAFSREQRRYPDVKVDIDVHRRWPDLDMRRHGGRHRSRSRFCREGHRS
jgi:transcriptional regulator GlxA family with amidase domain